jgi:hypothetical protein
VGKSVGKRPDDTKKRRFSWEVTIEINLKETCFGDVGLICLVQNRDQSRVLAKTVKNFRIPVVRATS